MSDASPTVTLGVCQQGQHYVCACGAIVLTCVCGAPHTRIMTAACGVCTATGGVVVAPDEED